MCSCFAHPLRWEAWIMAIPATRAGLVRSPKCSAISLAAMHSPFYIDWQWTKSEASKSPSSLPAVPNSGDIKLGQEVLFFFVTPEPRPIPTFGK
jgi:hypothetical protein